MAAHNVSYIERMLRAGKTPKELGGKEIGSGAFKTAYLFGDNLIVKENAQFGFAGKADKTPPRAIRRFGARAPRTYKAGKYILQERVIPLRDQTTSNWNVSHDSAAYKNWKAMYAEGGKNGIPHDVHEYNCGVDKNGQLVVFDW